jgi:hypothetical protein
VKQSSKRQQKPRATAYVAPGTSTPTSDETLSKNSDYIAYRGIRGRARKGSPEALIGHEWRCLRCNAIVHEEELIGVMDREETPEEASQRQLRIQQACKDHVAMHVIEIEMKDGEEGEGDSGTTD